jgi:hypothetical protein
MLHNSTDRFYRFNLIQRKNRVRRSYSKSEVQNASRQQQQEQQQRASDGPWLDDQEMASAEDHALSAASQVLPASMPDLGFAESCLLFGTDASSLDRRFTNHNDALNDFAEILKPSQHQQDTVSGMETAPPSSLWSSVGLPAWQTSPERLAAQPTTPAAQPTSDSRLGNTVMTIENLSPATREAIIELVLHDGGSLRIATK